MITKHVEIYKVGDLYEAQCTYFNKDGDCDQVTRHSLGTPYLLSARLEAARYFDVDLNEIEGD